MIAQPKTILEAIRATQQAMRDIEFERIRPTHAEPKAQRIASCTRRIKVMRALLEE